MRTLKSKAIKWLWDHRAFEWNYSSPYAPSEIEQRLWNALMNRCILFGWEKGIDGTVTRNAFSLHYVDAGEGRSVQLNGVFHASADGSMVIIQCKDSTDEQRMAVVVIVLVASIMTLGLGYPKFGLLVLFAPALYWIAYLVIFRSIFNSDLPVTLNALQQILYLEPIKP